MAKGRADLQRFRLKALAPGTAFFVSLFALGFVLRLPGLLFNGIHDLDEIIFKWGCAVKELGLARGFDTNYGVFSYISYGLAVALAEQLPRFWWAPYKAMELSFEIAVFLALRKVVPSDSRHWILLTYWLNPWFIVHGSWQGYWEGPHTFLALLAVWCLAQARSEKLAWAGAGASLMAAAMFKPQGLVYFAIPLGIYVGLQWLRRRSMTLLWYTAGSMTTLAFATGLLAIDKGGFWQIPRNYMTAASSLPNLCNACISIWRPLTVLLYVALGPDRFSSVLGPGSSLNDLLSLISFGLVFALIAWLAWQATLSLDGSRHSSALLILAFSSVVIPQLTTHAHINHTFAGLVLLVPFVLARRRMLVPWISMIAIHLYSHLAVYQLGRSIVVPEMYLDFAPAQPLLMRVNAALATQAYTPLLQFQENINQFLRHYLPVEPVVSQLSVLQFLCVLVLVREMVLAVRARHNYLAA